MQGKTLYMFRPAYGPPPRIPSHLTYPNPEPAPCVLCPQRLKWLRMTESARAPPRQACLSIATESCLLTFSRACCSSF